MNSGCESLIVSSNPKKVEKELESCLEETELVQNGLFNRARSHNIPARLMEENTRITESVELGCVGGEFFHGRESWNVSYAHCGLHFCRRIPLYKASNIYQSISSILSFAQQTEDDRGEREKETRRYT